MRCPKCGFISFDLVEACGKCGKNISGEAGLPKGTTTNIEPPRFLRLDAAEAEPKAPEDIEGAVELETEEAVMDMEEESSQEIEFSLDDEPAWAEETGTEEIEINLGPADIGLEETTPAEAAEEIDLSEIEEAPPPAADFTIDQGKEEPKFDFAAIDISDLAPTEKETDNLLVTESVAEVIVEETVVAKKAPAAPSSRTESAALEDLQFEGVDLETHSISAPDATTGKIAPSVKTGTALDSFAVDLGDLFADEKE